MLVIVIQGCGSNMTSSACCNCSREVQAECSFLNDGYPLQQASTDELSSAQKQALRSTSSNYSKLGAYGGSSAGPADITTPRPTLDAVSVLDGQDGSGKAKSSAQRHLLASQRCSMHCQTKVSGQLLGLCIVSCLP